MSSLIGRERRANIDAPRVVLRIRLIGGKEGHIPLVDLAGLAEGIQETVLRIARYRAERSGPGRTPDDLKDWITLEATGIEPGSAVLVVETPGLANQQLPLAGLDDPGLEALADLGEALDAMSRSQPLPSSFDRGSEQSLRTTVKKLSEYERIEWSHQSGDAIRIIELNPKAIDVTADLGPDFESHHESLLGRLYQVNLKSHGYGIEDHLEDIRQLVGRRIVLTGTAHRDDDGDIQRFEVEQIRAADEDKPAGEFFSFDIEATLSGARPIEDLSTLSIDDLTETEADLFWQALNE